MRDKEAPWCNWPNREYARPLEDLARMTIRCDAWRSFFSSETVVALKRIKGHILWFNRYEGFDSLLCEFDCTEKRLATTIRRLFHPDLKFNGTPARESPWTPIFRRSDIYDARAWADIPLDWFVPVSDWKPPTQHEHWLSDAEVLAANESPVLRFGIKLQWTVKRSCFTLRHRVKDGLRLAVMTFAHSDLDRRFENRRWVAEHSFPDGTPRQQMYDELMGQVREKAAKCLVTIEED